MPNLLETVFRKPLPFEVDSAHWPEPPPTRLRFRYVDTNDYLRVTHYQVTEETFLREERRKALMQQQDVAVTKVTRKPKPSRGDAVTYAIEYDVVPPPGLVCSARLA